MGKEKLNMFSLHSLFLDADNIVRPISGLAPELRTQDLNSKSPLMNMLL